MKRYCLVSGLCLCLFMGIFSCIPEAPEHKTEKDASAIVLDEDSDIIWRNFSLGCVSFDDKAPHSKGSRIFHRLIPDTEVYIRQLSRIVLHTLYESPEECIVPVHHLRFMLEDTDGVACKWGGNGEVAISCSTRHIEGLFKDDDDATKVYFEIRGVLLYELTHVYQQEPQGIGSYGTNREFRAFIEGMADAVRIANGRFHRGAYRPTGGSYMDGYLHAGYFFVWLRDYKDPEFLRKLNRSALEVVPWSFDGAVKYALGSEYHIDELWREDQRVMEEEK